MRSELITKPGVPEDRRTLAFAMSVIGDRIGRLPKADRDDLHELITAWLDCQDVEEGEGIERAIEELLAQAPITVQSLDLAAEPKMTAGLQEWAKHVGGKIKELREAAGLNQAQLAERAGLQQSHISRLERAEHSPTHKTLVKIAGALGIDVGLLDHS